VHGRGFGQLSGLGECLTQALARMCDLATGSIDVVAAVRGVY
jgi:hypothetical protein